MARRGAIYARYSSDLQSDRSVDDQVALCRDFAARNDIEIVGTYDDRARSGASVLGRTGLLDLLSDARTGAFDVVIVEALDRISRDQEDLAGIFKRLSFLGLEIVAVHEGVADHIQVGIRGLVGALYLHDLAHKVRRGMAGVVREGRHAGGRAYGYRPIPGKPGEMEIIEAEAAVIRRVFARYAAGDTPREIAAALNADGVPPPRGRFWRASVINGNRKRQNGILQNEVYAGRLVWNRVRMIKDPDTGRRVSRPNPESKWQRTDAAHLRIIDDEAWQAVRARDSYRPQSPHLARRPRRILSGRLKCGACGAGMSIKDRDNGRLRIMCSQAKEAGACDHRRAYYLDDIESRVIESLRRRLGSKSAIEHFIRVYNDERSREHAVAFAARSKAEARLAEAQRALDRAIDDRIAGRLSDEEADRRLPALRAERDGLKAALAATDEPPKVVSLHPTAVEQYLRDIDRLADLIADDPDAHDTDLADAVRSMIDSVVVEPAPAHTPPELVVNGSLARLTGTGLFPQARLTGGSMVAEEGLEPPTRGL